MLWARREDCGTIPHMIITWAVNEWIWCDTTQHSNPCVIMQLKCYSNSCINQQVCVVAYCGSHDSRESDSDSTDGDSLQT